MIARRSLVLGAGATTVTAAVAAMMRPFAGGPRVDAAADAPPARTIHLEAREVRWELAPGKSVRALAYDGRVPGPELRAKLNERVRIVFTNRLAEPTTIHWHGVDVPNAMDGVPDVTQRAVQPGDSFVYEFEALPAGTRWYHTHFQEHRQMDLGLTAPLIIEPTTPEPMAYDREVTLVLDDWATGTGPALSPTAEGTAGGRGRMGGMMGGMMRGGGIMGGRGMGGMMGGGMMHRGGASHEPAYDTMTINGKAHPAEPLRVRKGERVRLRLINASNEHTHVVRVAGHQLHVTHTDGNPLEVPVAVDAIPIAPSERYDAVLIAEHPGAWLLHCTQPGHAGAGEQGAAEASGGRPSRRRRDAVAARRHRPLHNDRRAGDAPPLRRTRWSARRLPGPVRAEGRRGSSSSRARSATSSTIWWDTSLWRRTQGDVKTEDAVVRVDPLIEACPARRHGRARQGGEPALTGRLPVVPEPWSTRVTASEPERTSSARNSSGCGCGLSGDVFGEFSESGGSTGERQHPATRHDAQRDFGPKSRALHRAADG
ncbi:MAG: multicopper oxidase family protein [Candidatus Rokuibacteriota bacterium]